VSADPAFQNAGVRVDQLHNRMAYFIIPAATAFQAASSSALDCSRSPNGHIVIDLTRETRAPHQPSEVVQDFAAVVKGYGLREVTGDRYGGEWPVESYGKQGITYQLAEKTASELYLAALPLFSNRQIELPENDRLKNQLLSLMRRTNPGGRDSVVPGQGDGSHADLANAIIGAVYLASQGAIYDGMVKFRIVHESEMAKTLRLF